MHGHRAAKVDPLNLLQREEVAAPNPARYGLTDPEEEYVIGGIVWHDHKPPSSQWPLKRIVSHMRGSLRWGHRGRIHALTGKVREAVVLESPRVLVVRLTVTDSPRFIKVACNKIIIICKSNLSC